MYSSSVNPVEPVNPEEPSGMNIWYIVLLAVVSIVLIGVGVFFFKRYSQKKLQSDLRLYEKIEEKL